MDLLYLDNIDEYVHDQDKIVTYKWLSLTLGVHVNTAKRMLYHYLEHKRKESSAPLHATYLVSGKSVDNGQTCHKVSVVREEELEDAKSKLSLVVSVHVYSVHKALLRDSGPLYSVDYDAVKSNLHDCNRYSAIRCPDAVPLSSAELEKVRESTQQPPPAAAPQNHKPQTNGTLSAKTAPKPKGIMGIFAKPASKKEGGVSETKTETKIEPKEEEPTVDVPKSKPAAKTNPMANFLSSQTKKPVQTVKQEEMDSSSTTETPPQPQKKRDVPTEQPAPQTSRDSRSKSKRVEDSDSDEERLEKKKRRRIKKPQPDSSDEEVIPDSPQQLKRQASPEPIREEDPATHPQKEKNTTKTRKRRRVLKSKTFTDDDGCIVTEKAYESESYSEAEEEPQKKPAPKPAPVRSQTDEKKKKVPSTANKSTKQASIMGFLNKK